MLDKSDIIDYTASKIGHIFRRFRKIAKIDY